MASFSPWACRILLLRAKHFQCYPVVGANLPDKIGHLHQRHAHNVSSSSQESPEKNRVHNKPTAKAITISRVMKAYMQRAKAYDDMMKAEVADFEIGKRHLANIMGEDPDSFTQDDVNRAIEYLLPSGIFDKKARPMMRNPYEIFPKRKAAQFGLDGRPFHWLYFTTLPNYYSILYDIAWKMENLKALEDNLRAEKKLDELQAKPLNLASSDWISQVKFKEKLVENVQEKEYKHFIVLMERLISHPLSEREEEFVMQFRILHQEQLQSMEIPDIEVDSEGKCFALGTGTRKEATAKVKVYKPGTGKISINNSNLHYFKNLMYRQTIMQPLCVSNLIWEVDIVAEVEGGGPTGHAGAIRLGIARALTAFVDDDVKEKLHIAGLLTRDPRTKERNKPGQWKARKKFTWKKR